nr:MAG TPA: hypothetical protein [Caudoviricetes sp.]
MLRNSLICISYIWCQLNLVTSLTLSIQIIQLHF